MAIKKTSLSLKQKADKLSEKGAITFSWNGGNDSGWVEVMVGGELGNGEIANELSEVVDTELGYGSWGGDFSASGEATYDPKTGMIMGIDSYNKDDDRVVECSIKIEIPAKIWFDRLDIEMGGMNEYVDVSFFLRNGIECPWWEPMIRKLQVYLEIQRDQVLENVTEEVHGSGNSFRIPRREFKKEGDNLVFVIDALNYSTPITTEKDISIDLNNK